MQGTADNVFLYENESLQRKARSLVPVSELQEKAKAASDKSRENGEEGFDERDFFILELYAWFKGKKMIKKYFDSKILHLLYAPLKLK